MEYYLIAVNIAAFTWLIPVIFLLLRRQPSVFRWLTICLLLSFVTEMAAKVLFFYKINPNYAASVYILVSTVCLSYFFYQAIEWKALRIPLIYINIFYLVFEGWNLLQLQRSGPNSYSFILQCLLILALSIVFFYKMLKELPTLQVQKDPLFLIISGFFFSNAGKIVLFGVMHYFINELKDNGIILGIIQNVLTIVGNIAIAVGAYLNYKQGARQPYGT